MCIGELGHRWLCPCSTGQRCHGACTAYEKIKRIRSKIAEMVWLNISGATISYVLCIKCASMAHWWRTCGAYGVWMAMPLCMMSCMRTRHSVHPTYARRSTRFYGVWWAYVQRMGCVHAEPINTYYICELWMWHLNVQLHAYVSKCPV